MAAPKAARPRGPALARQAHLSALGLKVEEVQAIAPLPHSQPALHRLTAILRGAQEVPLRIQELLSALCADGGRLRHQHTRNMVRRLLQYVGLDALVLAVVYLVRFLQLTKLAPSDRIDTLYLAAVILADKFSNDDNFCDLASTICLLCGVRAEVLVTQENRILGVLLRASSLMVAPAVFRQVLRLVFEVRWGRLKQRGALAILERLSSDADDGLHPLPFDSPHDGAPEDASWADFLLPGLGSGSMLGALPALLASGMSTATELARSLRPRSASLHASPEGRRAARAAALPPSPRAPPASPRRAARAAAPPPTTAASSPTPTPRPPPPPPPRRRRAARARRGAAAAAAEAAAAEAARQPSASMPPRRSSTGSRRTGAVDMADATRVAGQASVLLGGRIGARLAAAVLAPRRRAAHGSHAPSRRASCTLETILARAAAPRPDRRPCTPGRPPRRRRSPRRSGPSRRRAAAAAAAAPPRAGGAWRASRPLTRRPPRAAPPPSPPPRRRRLSDADATRRRRDTPPSRGRVQPTNVLQYECVRVIVVTNFRFYNLEAHRSPTASPD